MKESLVHAQGQTLFRNWTNRLGMYLLAGILAGLVCGMGGFAGEYFLWFTPAQKFYYPDYLYARIVTLAGMSPHGTSRYELLVEDVKNDRGENIGRVLEPEDFIQVEYDSDRRKWKVGFDQNKFKAGITTCVLVREDRYMGQWFRENYFQGWTHVGLWTMPVSLGLLVGVTGFGFLTVLDHFVNRDRRRGVILRGTRTVTLEKFNREVKGDGLGIFIREAWKENDLYQKTLRERLWPIKKKEREWLRIRRWDEPQHIRVSADTGAGKTQLLGQLLEQLEGREVPVIVNDPDGILARAFYRPERGDVILNPFDARMPFWSLLSEIETKGDLRAVAESLFPGRDNMAENAKFFIERSRELFCRMMEFKPSAEELIEWMSDEHKIDELTKGTPLEQVLSRNAGPQRQGVLGTVAGLAKHLEILPRSGDSKWSAREWAKKRKGWIFLTSRTADREAVTPLHSIWVDLLIMRLMTNQKWAAENPVYFVMSEFQILRRLPKFERGLTEMRKYGGCWVLEYQGEDQLVEDYGKRIVTLMSQAKTKIALRTSEARAAETLSKTFGMQEVLREEISTTEGVQDARDSTNHRPDKKWEAAVPATIITDLPDLEGFLKLEDRVVRFQIEYREARQRHPGFVERLEVVQKPDDRWEVVDLSEVEASIASGIASIREQIKVESLNETEASLAASIRKVQTGWRQTTVPVAVANQMLLAVEADEAVGDEDFQA